MFNGFASWRDSKNHTQLMEMLRGRAVFSGICGVLIFAFITYRLADTMVVSRFNRKEIRCFCRESTIRKADIVDRNGELLATSIATASCYADPSVIFNIDETVSKLSQIPGMPNPKKIRVKLSDKGKHFVWIARHITPKIQEQVMDLGLPGIFFQKDYKRIYIHGNLFSHVIGCCDVDGCGVCGLERSFSEKLVVDNSANKKLVTSLDLRIQAIVHEELQMAIEKFRADGGNAILMSMNGEILSIVSLPDFDSNNLKNCRIETLFNKNTLGVFEQGSILKILNVAIALDSGAASLGSVFDASTPIKIGRFSIKDFKGKGRPLTLAEAFVFSSNIASAKVALSFGAEIQKEYMRKFGMFDKLMIEVPELGAPIVPRNWTEATCMSVSYGYGIAVSPLQLLTTVASIVNDGIKISPTLIYGRRPRRSEQPRIVSSETSTSVRELMRAVVCFGTAKKSAVDGIDVFGKTGTAYKTTGYGYGNDGNRKRITTFIGGFPKDHPQYMLLISIDNPKSTSETFGYATAGWNVAPTAKNVLKKIIPILHDGRTMNADQQNLKVVKYIKLDK
jgi:cell division protein FtsI (penicillin-binding protein 3)